MPPEFVIAKNPNGGSRLPYLLRLPLAPRPLILAARSDWPVEKDVYCFELTDWPANAEVIACVPVVTCQRRGAAVELVLDRAQRRRSLFVWTMSRQGKRLVFWRSERSMRSTRPGVRAPHARGLDGAMTVVIDTRERYPWRFATNPVTTERRQLPVGDYGVFDGDELAAVVERKKLQEFVGSAVNGQLALAMAELAAMPRAAVIIEGRLGKLLAADQTRVKPGWILNLTAALQAAYPNVPLLFAESAPLAADLAYRWLSACMKLRQGARRGRSIGESLADVLGDVPVAPGSPEQPVGVEPSQLATPLFAPLLDPLGQPYDPLGGRAVRKADAPLDAAGRQRLALERAAGGQPVTVAQHAEACGVSGPTASKDLRELEAAGQLLAQGRGRGLRFLLPL